ncbi:hypothetical protein BGX38DRAFT_812959 [Terfezia claveryi]|nr:hypothetical protein BGX38DRAFT_812959 [Terfezia claveryi]
MKTGRPRVIHYVVLFIHPSLAAMSELGHHSITGSVSTQTSTAVFCHKKWVPTHRYSLNQTGDLSLSFSYCTTISHDIPRAGVEGLKSALHLYLTNRIF